MRATNGRGTAGVIDKETDDNLRVLVIAESTLHSDEFDTAVRIWPHRLEIGIGWAAAIQKSEHFKPAIVCAPIPKTNSDKELCRVLRAQHVDIPMIGYADADAERNTLLRDGVVDIAVHSSELSCPSVTGLFEQTILLCGSSVGEKSGWENHVATPLRRSQMIGSIIASTAGVVQWANTCVARWLGYPDAGYLLGVDFARRHLKRSSDWKALGEAADDKEAFIQAEISALDVDSRWIAFKVEVSAEPACLTLLRLSFLDETRNQLYKATAELAYKKATDDHKAVL